MMIISSVASAQNNSTLSKHKLKGKVKVLLYTEYEVDDKFGKLTKGKISYVEKYFYNNRGYKKKLIIYGKSGNPHEIVEYFYNSKDELNEFTILRAWMKKPENEIEELLFDGFYVFEDIFYKHDKKGNRIEDNLGMFYSATNFNFAKNKYYYDNNNNYIKRELYSENPSDEINVSWEYRWDSNGNLIELLASGNINEREVNNYNYNNDIIKTTTYYHKGKVGEETTFEYLEYDVNKNWVKRIVYKNDNPLIIEERDIKYHR